ncbi:MAG: methyltransferase domain-containing protein, partial [Alphaproteobacteria bacterium]|nr:methyltransferase domain-containing protein [Alphaproteobacteria bacterium]
MTATAEATTPDRQVALIWDHLRGFHAVHLMATGIESGLFEAMKKRQPVAAAALAQELGLHPPYVETWIKTACAYGLVDLDGEGRASLAPYMAEILTAPGHPLHLASYVGMATRHIGPELFRHQDFLKTGGTVPFQEHGVAFSELVADTTAGLQTVVARKLLPAAGLADKLKEGCRILDVGCGTGGLMLKLAQAWPKVRCHGIDIDDHGLASARQRIAASGLADRVAVERVGADGPKESGAFDAATLFEVLHEIGVDYRPAVLAQVHRALKPGGVLFILDETYPSNTADLRKPEYAFAVQTAYNELVWGNVVPTREEQEKLLAEAGFIDLRRDL